MTTAPYLEVKRDPETDVRWFEFNSLIAERIPARVLFPSSGNNTMLDANLWPVGAMLYFDANRTLALYEHIGQNGLHEQ